MNAKGMRSLAAFAGLLGLVAVVALTSSGWGASPAAVLVAQDSEPNVVYLKYPMPKGFGGSGGSHDAKTTSLEGEDDDDEEDGEPAPPEVSRMARAKREVQEAKELEARQLDPDVDGLQEPHDHWYYSGPAVHRKIDMTDIREKGANEPWIENGQSRGVSSIPDTYTGAAVSSQQAMYKPKPKPPEHDVMMDVDLANIENPTREMIGRALEHIQSEEIGTEYLHDTLVDNDKHSWRYQEHIHVKNVPGSRSSDNSMLSYNGIGGIFGVGAMLGPKDPRPEIPLKAIIKPDEGDTIHWHSKEVLDTERVLTAGTSFTDKPRSGLTSPSGFNGNHDVAQAILRHSDPNYDIKANTFLNYNPAEPPAKNDPTLYVHTWAAYTPEGSKRREEAARGQLAYEEWRKTHPMQVCMHTVPRYRMVALTLLMSAHAIHARHSLVLVSRRCVLTETRVVGWCVSRATRLSMVWDAFTASFRARMMTMTYSLLQAPEGRMVPVVAARGRAAREGAEKMLKPNKLDSLSDQGEACHR